MSQAADELVDNHGGRWIAVGRTLLVFLAIGIFVVFRSFEAFTSPAMAFEDGPDEYVYYLTHTEPASIFRFYAGYASVLPNICCYLIARLPPKLVPHAMAGYALLLTCAAFSAFSLSRFRYLVRDDWIRAAMCLVLVIMPFEDVLHVSCANYSLWHLLLILVLLILVPAPVTKVGLFVQAMTVALLVWSHPLAVICAPVCGFFLLARSGWNDRVLNAWTIVVVISYYFLGVDHAEARPMAIGSYLTTAVEYTAHRVIFESVFGNAIRVTLASVASPIVLWVGSGLLLLFALVLSLMQKTASERHRFLGALVGIVAIAYGLTFLSLLARSVDADQWMGARNQRYFFVSKVLFFGLLLAMVFQTLGVYVTSRAKDRFITVLIVLFVAAIGVSTQRLYTTTIEDGRKVHEFFNDFDEQLRRKRQGEPYTPVVKLDRGGRWDIVIDVSKLGGGANAGD